jgi:uncharacterized protein YciI
MLEEGRRLEQSGQLPEAAAVYQKMVTQEPDNQDAISRLLVMYRKLKEYRKELAVVEDALQVYEQRDKTLQENWLKTHPKAAGAGKAIFKKLGGASVSAMGADRVVNGLLKRKAFIQKRLHPGKKKPPLQRRQTAQPPKDAAATAASSRKQVAATARKQAAATTAAARKQATQQRKAATAAARKQAAIAAAARKEAAAATAQKQATAAARKQTHPSLFVILLRYLVPLDEIDREMPHHISFLEKYYKKGNFIVSGRQVPRTGGIILAKGKNRNAVEQIMKQDPFVKKKLASVDIIEFSASQTGKGWPILCHQQLGH